MPFDSPTKDHSCAKRILDDIDKPSARANKLPRIAGEKAPDQCIATLRLRRHEAWQISFKETIVPDAVAALNVIKKIKSGICIPAFLVVAL